MPALEIVRKFSNERGITNAQLDFIAFIDGDEKNAVRSLWMKKLLLERCNDRR